ncbi:MAG: Ig-like domain-containing protein, partial [Betaproteobacteria bacterium]
MAAAAASGFLISSCGGSAPGPSPTNPNPATPTIASITLSLDRVIVKNAGEPPVKVTANAVNSNGQAVSGVPLTFTVDPGSSISPGSGPTNAQGAATADVTLLDRTNRVVTVRVASGAVISSASFSVTGAQLTYTIGTSQVTAGGTAKVNFLLRDASDSPMPDQKITLSSSLNNFTPISATTNANGQYELTYTATKAGSDVITASAAGASPLSPPTIQVGTGVLPNPSATP